MPSEIEVKEALEFMEKTRERQKVTYLNQRYKQVENMLLAVKARSKGITVTKEEVETYLKTHKK